MKSEEFNMDLTQIRDEINRVDDQLVKLFVERMELASQVAAYKKEHNMPIYHRALCCHT